MARLKIKQTRSGVGRLGTQKRVLKALGLKHPGSIVEHEDTPTIRGMIDKVPHLIEVEVVEKETESSGSE